MICPVCGRSFDPANRAQPGATAGAIDRIKYDTERCARKAENARYYQAHKRKIVKRVTRNQKRQKRRKPMEQGEHVALKTDSGKPSRSKYNQGTVITAGVTKSLVEFLAEPATGMAYERVWCKNADLVKIKH